MSPSRAGDEYTADGRCAGADLQTDSYEQQHTKSALVVADKCLGWGKCGSILAGR
jgi:hypothetical protein